MSVIDAQYLAAEAAFQQHCERHSLNLGGEYFGTLHHVAARIQTGIAGRSESKNYFVGISGAQGSGKSTFASLLEKQLTWQSSLNALVLSLDDFYLPRMRRMILAREVHPLLMTRGVPGTHDVDLLARVLAELRAGHETMLPRFDKAVDDRVNEVVYQPLGATVVLMEGWCWGALPANSDELLEPVNSLEKEEDEACVWRNYVNEQLKAYQALFRTDFSIFLAVPGMQSVRSWRWLQEQQLSAGKRVMDRVTLNHFVMHYERITLRMLAEMPDRADLTLKLNKDHHFVNTWLESGV